METKILSVQVVAVGSGKADDKGNVVKSSLSVGDTVLYSKYTGVEFEVNHPPYCAASSAKLQNLFLFLGIRSCVIRLGQSCWTAKPSLSVGMGRPRV